MINTKNIAGQISSAAGLLLVLLTIVIALNLFLNIHTVGAAGNCPSGQVTTLNDDGSTGCSPAPEVTRCEPKGGLNIPTCGGNTYYQCQEGESTDSCIKNNPMVAWVVFFVNLTATIIIIGASTMLIVAGIQYIAAADNAQKIQAAKDKIKNVLIGILAFFFMYAFLQWLIPGGAF